MRFPPTSRAGAVSISWTSTISTSCATFSRGPGAEAPHPEKSWRLLRRLHEREHRREEGRRRSKPEMKRIAAIRVGSSYCTGGRDAPQRDAGAVCFYSQPDMHDANQTIAYIDQGGITLPDRDYYIKTMPSRWRRARSISSTCRRCSSWREIRPTSQLKKPRQCSPLKPVWPRLPWTAPSVAIPRIAIT